MNYIFIVGVLLFVIGAAGGLYYEGNTVDSIGPCYDSYEHLIVGLDCVVTQPSKMMEIYVGILILSIMFIAVSGLVDGGW